MDLLESPDAPILPRPPECDIPLTAVQQHLWSSALKRGSRLSDMRLVVTSVRILGPLDPDLLSRCIEAVVQRHESLRTRIISVAGAPRQQIDTHGECQLVTVDLTATASSGIELETRRCAQEFIHAQVDLSVGPLLDAKLLRLASEEHVLLLGLDHMVCDGASTTILSREIWTLYRQGANQLPFSLPPLPVQLADYAVWQQQTLHAWLRRHDAYWRGRLGDAPYIVPPCDSSLDEQPCACPTLQIPLGKALTLQLRQAARRERTPLSTVVLTLFAAVISHWCDQDDFVMGFMSHGRHRPELANMVGYIASPLYLRVTLHREDSLLDLMRRIAAELDAAHEHRDHGRAPALYLNDAPPDIVFNWTPASWSPQDWAQSDVRSSPKVSGELQIHPFPVQPRPIEADALSYFGIAPSDTTAGIIFTLAYRADRFSRQRIDWLFQNMRSFSEQFVTSPQSCVRSLRLLP